MDQLIPINYDNERQTVCGRALHEFLKVGTAYKDWFPRMCEYGFTEGTDFCSILSESTGGRPALDHQITIEMAKEIAMLQRTEKGKQARLYFIELERRWNSPEAVMARALKMADRKILALESQIEQDKPKVEFFNQVAESKDAQEIGVVAKVLNMGIGRNKLFELLRNQGILMRDNIPYQKFIDAGYFRTIEQKYTKPDGSTSINIKTVVYQKGLDYIRRIVNNSKAS